MLQKMKVVLIIALSLTLMLLAACGGDVGPTPDAGDGEVIVVMPEQFTQEAVRTSKNGQRRQWDKVSSYFINLGSFHSEMTAYDVGIVDDSSIGGGLSQLNSAGVWTFARVSLGEDMQLRAGDRMGPGGLASYYMFEGGRPAQNMFTGGYYANAGNHTWRSLVSAQIAELSGKGYDGIYLDGLDTCALYPELENGCAEYIELLSQQFPSLKFVVNGGFSMLPTIHDFIDGVVFENFCTYFNSFYEEYKRYDENDPAYTNNLAAAVNTINAIRQENYFPVFSLDYVQDILIGGFLQDVYDNAWTYDFIPYIPLGGKALNGDVASHLLVPSSARGSKALIAPVIPQPVLNGDVSELNLAYAGNGGKIAVDSSYAGYGFAALNDGYIGNADNIDIIDWSKICWASAEQHTDHFIEITAAAPAIFGEIVIEWAYDGGLFWTSQNVIVEAFIDGEWVQIGAASDIAENTPSTSIALTVTSPASKVRVLQSAGDGPFTRPDIMWVSEVALYAQN